MTLEEILFFLILVVIVWAILRWATGTEGEVVTNVRSALREYSYFGDKYKNLEEVQEALRQAGLESSNLIIGIDYTKSNTWTGKKTFGGRCLHDIQPGRNNPYQEAIRIIGRTLEPFDDDQLVPAFGFGDSTTTDKQVFGLSVEKNGVCHGFAEVLDRYETVTPRVSLSGPTSFAPLIYRAIEIVQESKSYHILLIIADGQVNNERQTVDAIVEASKYPLSIIMVGVGDGPWDTMNEFDNRIPERKFDNFQFVNFSELMDLDPQKREVEFACRALMEVPDQFKAVRKLHLL
eukprot:TRINITY_DN3609_c0_g1_i3.p1 TRINITY_DN3609_c0_g1~~TRINITY_DN3609_c0_g1_i3.p1  ORF type:complete len:291 (-),score=57.39 TRINITY_DN3609_c0_g1_i3:37-909(-)